MTSPRLDRRALLGCAALCGVAAPILTACSSDRADDAAGGANGNGAGEEGEESGSPAEAGAALVAVADVPVGAGVVLAKEKVVVVQPEDGQFQAFSAVCTHQGCTVGEVAGGTINCPCHGSRFAIDDGSVVSGPASNPLPEVQVRVRGGEVVRA